MENFDFNKRVTIRWPPDPALRPMNRENRANPSGAPTRLFREGPLAPGQTAELDEQAAHHALRVLRLRPGDAVELFNGDGRRYRGRLVAHGERGAAAEIHEAADAATESPLWLGLAQAVPSGDKMDWVVEKAVELGVACIQPLLSSRCVVRLDASRAARRHEHWQRIVVAACMQSGRDRLPEVLPVQAFDDWVASPPPDGARLVLSPRGERSLSQALAAVAGQGGPGESDAPATADGSPGRFWLLAGPEGGLDDEEASRAIARGWAPLRLGPRVLRTETAGLAALAALQSRLGDF